MKKLSSNTTGTAMLKPALNEDLTFASRLGIHSLPAYLMQYEDKTILMQSFEYQDFSDALKSLMQ